VPSKRIAVLLLAFAPAVAAAHTVRVPSQAELRRAWQACIAVDANYPLSKGVMSTRASAWPRGFRGCAAIVRDMDARESAESKIAWQSWVAKHAAEQALIRKTAERQHAKPINWAKFNRACAKAAKRAAKDTP